MAKRSFEFGNGGARHGDLRRAIAWVERQRLFVQNSQDAIYPSGFEGDADTLARTD